MQINISKLGSFEFMKPIQNKGDSLINNTRFRPGIKLNGLQLHEMSLSI
jgi:hypothetical protein